MSDYKELVEELRDKHIEDRYKRLTLDAAAAIEELQAEVKDAVNEGYNAGYTAGIGYCSFKRAKKEVQDGE